MSLEFCCQVARLFRLQQSTWPSHPISSALSPNGPVPPPVLGQSRSPCSIRSHVGGPHPPYCLAELCGGFSSSLCSILEVRMDPWQDSGDGAITLGRLQERGV